MFAFEPLFEKMTTSLDGKAVRSGEFSFSEVKVPRQMKKEEFALTQMITDLASDTVIMYFGSSVFLSVFFAGLMQYLWGMVNTLQIIVVTGLFTIVLPLNAQTMMFTIMHLTNLDLLNSLDIVSLEQI